jgi:hypothetical protein
MRRAFVFVAAVLAAGTASVVAQQLAAGPAESDWKPTEIKNLTVLPKDMSPDDVMKVMRAWNTALSVDCVFCHVGQVGKPLSTFDFASDTKKRKGVSRIMLKSVMATNEAFKAIEADDTPTVQCSTCHKRSRHVDADLPPEKPKDEPHD